MLQGNDKETRLSLREWEREIREAAVFFCYWANFLWQEKIIVKIVQRWIEIMPPEWSIIDEDKKDRYTKIAEKKGWIVQEL